MAKILLIDDDALVQEAVGHMLKSGGHSIILASDGAQGVESFTRNKPDLVIVDIIMPNQDGLESIMAMRNLDSQVPIIAITGSGASSNVDFLKAATAFGANKTVRKPFGPGALLEVVSECLNGR